jgi:hypothetical protein
MGFMSYPQSSAVLNHLLAGGSSPYVSTLYLGLCTGLATNGTISGEPNGNGYTRKSVAVNGTTIFGTSGNDGKIKNNGSSGGTITFDTASGSWGTLTYWFLSSTSGNNNNGTWLIGGLLTSSVTVSNAQAPTFAPSQLQLDATGW